MVKQKQTCTPLWVRRGPGRRLIRMEQQRRLSIDYPAPVGFAAVTHEISAASDEYDEEVVHEEEEGREEQKV